MALTLSYFKDFWRGHVIDRLKVAPAVHRSLVRGIYRGQDGRNGPRIAALDPKAVNDAG